MKSRGPIGFCTFKASRRQPDVAQPQFTANLQPQHTLALV